MKYNTIMNPNDSYRVFGFDRVLPIIIILRKYNTLFITN